MNKIFLSLVFFNISIFCMEATQPTKPTKDIALKAAVKEKVNYFNHLNDPRIVSDYLAMKGNVLSIPLRLEEILQVGPRLIYMKNSYTTDDKINFLENIKNSWDKYKKTIDFSNASSAARKDPLHIFECINYFLNIAKINGIHYFNISEPLDKYGNNIIHTALNNNECITFVMRFTSAIGINKQNNDGYTPLHLAILNYSKNPNNYLQAIRALILKKADLNIPDNKGDAPLHLAAQKKLLPIARYLIKRGANINAKNKAGETPVDIWPEIKEIKNVAHKKEDLKPVQDFLDKYHIDINLIKDGPDAIDTQGRTALMHICERWSSNRQFYDLIELLLKAGANIDAQQPGNDTALIAAVNRMFYPKLVLFLLSHGARPDIVGLYGETAKSRAITLLKKWKEDFLGAQAPLKTILNMLEEAEKEQASEAKLE